MAIYHFSAKVISRANGSSAVASAAYRSASELHDDRLGRDHDFSNKAGVIHSEVMLPEGAPERLNDRSTLWNEVEAGEKRKDAQLAREVEFSIPREMNEKQGVQLARDFVQKQFVDRGMVADLNVHWDKAKDGTPKPHAHVMLAMRDVGPEGFGKKNRDWNSTEQLKEWREAWAAHVNERMAELGLEGRIDHRSYEAQGIELEPQHKIGPAASRRPGQGLEAERIEDHARIARDNGEKIIANPSIALDAITRQQATFTTRDLAVFAFRHSDGKEQFDQVIGAVRASPELVALGKDGRDQERFTSRDMIAVEARLERSAGELAARDGHGVADRHRDAAIGAAEGRGLVLSAEQRDALDHITGSAGLASVVGYAGSGKSAMLGVAREAWEREGYTVRGAALSGIAAENLEGGSGISSRTIASLEHAWEQGREQLGPRDVLVVDEAGMIGSRQMERVLSQARDAGAKVVMVGDPEQLQAIEAGAAFRSVTERHGAAEITEIRRQREDWQRDATRALATGRTGEAIHAYDGKGMVHAADTREQARGELVDGWDRARQAEPGKSRVILTHTNAEVRELNEEARGRLRASGDLGDDVTFSADRGTRAFARGDRLMFLRNERSLGVKNGTLGTIEQVSAEGMKVRLDNGARVAFDAKDYAAVDHGYAATFHKAQGVTVDRAHVLATPGMDRHSAYVGMSRHRDGAQLHYGRDDFADLAKLVRALSRDRGKDMAGDYARPERDQARAFADRREIRFPELARQVAEKVRDKARGMFAGFRPKPAAEKTTSPERVAADRSLAPSQARAIERYGRAAADIGRMQDKGLPVLAHQEQALAKAGDALDQVRPNGARDLASAIERDPRLARDAAEGNTGGAAKAMEVERQVRIDPEKRAGRFVEQWQGMKAARASMERAGDRAGAEKLGKRMESIAVGLHRDPQLESALKRRAPELALNMERGRSIGQELAQSVGQGRDRDRGMSR
ncbi:Ti-type conjugative transfer relaxase TraA [Sphingomonas paucimobilis]|jgi:Ti-type conjugative transfer relaxase TraA|uniref:Ti-type conjugative transfer relaxase TraA n=2 Tax=Sphingomonas paucimobilis TaxID=13689 RepID=A0A7Y2KTM6_SPHPI|nr:Ti-type conjugative transfer relaxase TraA [Sphingomonas paucimobilis]MCM3681664.1 Ti-type conjugative transfer relaxase TraA [Sphingomonas paucimobilis]NNG59959.1 Ti-type conjugative transfer relaxase TraA [Sphingomonas paucimobilis]